jgi:hypothetical protein
MFKNTGSVLGCLLQYCPRINPADSALALRYWPPLIPHLAGGKLHGSYIQIYK